MCGVVGIALPEGAVPDPALLRAMADTLAHRGPDGDGVEVMPGCGFGHRRLAIVDLSPASAQPMRSPDDGAMLTFNGEVYDYAAVRARLVDEGERFRSTGDTEVLLHALRRWGLDALSHIHGMFAFGYWDARARTLLLGRDRYGKKPLYYAALGPDGREGLVFASELRALLAHPRVRAERAIDVAAVSQFLTHEFVPQPRSILANVRKLGPGEALRWDEARGPRVEVYERPVFGNRVRASTEALADEFLRRVDRAVARRLVADVPVGIFLSGGLDSSLVAACAVRHHPRVKTFAIGFEDPSFDERAHAESVARHLGTDHRVEVLAPGAMLDLLPSVLDAMDEPHADTSILPTTLLARLARREVTVALGGDGGDEILAGYPTFSVDQLRLPAAPRLGRAMASLASRFPPSGENFSTGFKLRQMSYGLGDRGALRHARWLASVDPSELPALLGPALREGIPHALDAARAAGDGAASDFDAATAFYLRVYLGEGVLQKVDRATMRVSLEARAPLLDTEVVSFCLSLPETQRVRGGTTKWLMRKAMRAMVPREILERPKKGFGAPVGQWLRGPLRDFMRDTLSPARLAESGWFEPSTVQRWIDEHLDGRADHRKPLYTLLVLEHWRRRWLMAP
ncbi:MAG: asparagine synthase (glutamine-hydrolyzing) [Polyangiales bacterium]